MKNAALYLVLLLVTVSCVKEKTDPEPIVTPIPKLYPVKIVNTRSDSPDSVITKFTYDTANQITREDVYTNLTLESYKIYTYNATGKQIKKTVYKPDGSIYEQDEISYNPQNLPEKLQHSMTDGAGNLNMHHSENYLFNQSGNLTEITGFWPGALPKDRSTYQYVTEDLIKVTLFNDQNQLLMVYEVQNDNKVNPFYATNRNVVQFAKNEQSRIFKDQNGNITFSVNNAINYNSEGYPVKIIKTQSGGLVLTETYSYRQ